MATSQQTLSAEQVRALLNILTHHKTYAEMEALKEPAAWPRFGFPLSGSKPGLESSMAQLGMQSSNGTAKASEAPAPLLQTLLVQFVLPLPGVRDFPQDWWPVRAMGIVSRLAQADLSEAYDKGGIGSRKTLTTASSSVLEMIARTSLAGLPRRPLAPHREYDRSRADELSTAYADLVQATIYGDVMVDAFFDHFAKTQDLDSFLPSTPAVTDYIVIHLAGLVHQIVVRSPEGPYLVKLLDNVQTMIPWMLIKQTLRVGNAATMINGILKLLLAKISTSNVMGRSKNGDEGTNLLQKIISLVLGGDASEFRKAATKIEKAKDRPNDQDLATIREHVNASRETHEAVRAASARNSQSIVMAILYAQDPNRPPSLTEAQHAQCLEYYSALLAVRDREAISASLCREAEDHLTHAVRDGVGAFTPMIRLVHERVDLKMHIDALQNFIDDFIKLSKPGKKGAMPSVGDYVKLLHKHRGFLYRFLHHIASRSPEVWGWFRAWAKKAVANFRQPEAGADMDSQLQQLFASLDPAARDSVVSAVDAHAGYLASLERLSLSRLQAVASGQSDEGVPGAYLARWQDLLDHTTITPAQPRGSVRSGRDVKSATTRSKTGASSQASTGIPDTQLPAAPDVSVVVRALGDEFGRIARERATALQAQVEL